MTYDEVINTIENKHRFGKACGRDVTAEFMEVLGHPEQGMHFIHIAGTNGKGSVAAFVSSILQAASFASDEHFKVGTFTSPHLIDFSERIVVDGKAISHDDVRRIGEMLLSKECKLEPTMFDYCLAMAMIYFKEQGVKYVVLETGLGGSKDSTSGLSIVPEVSAITSIGLEHTAILGDTIEQIAGEKAGILKAGTKAVIGAMEPAAIQVIIRKCCSLNIPYTQVSEPLDKSIPLGLFGDFQRYNAKTAAEIVKALDIKIDDAIIKKGLSEAYWPGRMQIISQEPYILLDGAHNPNGVTALKESLEAEFNGEKFTFIMAVMADKDYQEMAQIIKPIASRVFTVTVDYSRALQASALATSLNKIGFDAASCGSFDEALKQAKTYNEKIIVFGSLYFIGEILQETFYDKK